MKSRGLRAVAAKAFRRLGITRSGMEDGGTKFGDAGGEVLHPLKVERERQCYRGHNRILPQEEPLVAHCHLPDGKNSWAMLTEVMAKRMNRIDDGITALTVRVPRGLVSDIDDERNARPVRVPRNTWILEAVVEKLDREKRGPVYGSGQGADDGKK